MIPLVGSVILKVEEVSLGRYNGWLKLVPLVKTIFSLSRNIMSWWLVYGIMLGYKLMFRVIGCSWFIRPIVSTTMVITRNYDHYWRLNWGLYLYLALSGSYYESCSLLVLLYLSILSPINLINSQVQFKENVIMIHAVI